MVVGGFVWVRLFELVRTCSGSLRLFLIVLGYFGCNKLFKLFNDVLGCFSVSLLFLLISATFCSC